MLQVVGEEYYGSTKWRGILQRKLVRSEGDVVTVVDYSDKYTTYATFFRSVFLPQGYPNSVSGDYLEYQLWDTIQAFASSITGSLAAERMLLGLGVGQQGASVLGATLTWIVKNGTGMIGQITFAWLHGTSLDCDAKMWRLRADILNDVSIFLEILAPMFGAYFIIAVCLAGLGKSIVGVAGGATRASLTQHQARRNNLADVAAKDGSQETLVNLIALICSLIILPVVSGKPLLIWFMFSIFTAVHLYSNYRAVTCVVMDDVNESRLHFLCRNFFIHGTPLTVTAANRQEPVILKLRRAIKVLSGISLSRLSNKLSQISRIAKVYPGERYLLNFDPTTRCVTIAYHENATVVDKLKSYFQAEVIEFALSDVKQSQSGNLAKLRHLIQQDDQELLSVSKRITDETFPLFLASLSRYGWRTDRALLGSDEWRVTWTT